MATKWDWDAICRACDDEGDLEKTSWGRDARRRNHSRDSDTLSKAQQKKKFKEYLDSVTKTPRKVK